MELRHLRAFQTVAEELHFSRAAAKLHVAQPALSRTIADLEAEMDVLLVERNSRGVRLTDAGNHFLARVRQILDDAHEAVIEAQRRSRGETGSLRIGFIGTLSHSLLPRLLQTYRSQFPAVDIVLRELGPTQQRHEILAGHLDCGFIGLATGGADAELEMVLAAEDNLVAAIPEHHRLAVKKSVSLPALKAEPFYLTARSNAPTFNPWVIRLCQKAGFEPQIARETDRSATVLNYVAAGFGVSIFPSQIATIETPGVRFLPMGGNLPRYQYRLAWARKNNSQVVREFATLVKEQAARRRHMKSVKEPSGCRPQTTR